MDGTLLGDSIAWCVGALRPSLSLSHARGRALPSGTRRRWRRTTSASKATRSTASCALATRTRPKRCRSCWPSATPSSSCALSRSLRARRRFTRFGVVCPLHNWSDDHLVIADLATGANCGDAAARRPHCADVRRRHQRCRRPQTGPSNEKKIDFFFNSAIVIFATHTQVGVAMLNRGPMPRRKKVKIGELTGAAKEVERKNTVVVSARLRVRMSSEIVSRSFFLSGCRSEAASARRRSSRRR